VEIKAFVDSEKVGAEISLDDFLKALVEELGNPVMIMTKTQMLARMKQAADTALNEMKSATKFVV